MGHYVYKYVLDNEIIYIGKNDTDLYSRLYQHGRSGDNIPQKAWDDINSSDIFYFETLDSNMSDFLESVLIHRHKPKYNSAKRGAWDGYDSIPEPDWKPVPKIPKGKIQKQDKDEKNYLKPPYTNTKKNSLKEQFKKLYQVYKGIVPFYDFFRENLNDFPKQGFIISFHYPGLGYPYALPRFVRRSEWSGETLKLFVEDSWQSDVESFREVNEIEKEMDYIDELLRTHYSDALIEPKRSHISDFYPYYRAYKNKEQIFNARLYHSTFDIQAC